MQALHMWQDWTTARGLFEQQQYAAVMQQTTADIYVITMAVTKSWVSKMQC
jgi:hypothetical protein